MEILNMPRGSGKTTMLINAAIATNGIILVRDKNSVQTIANKVIKENGFILHDKNLNDFIMTVADYKNYVYKNYVEEVYYTDPRPVYIDEIDIAEMISENLGVERKQVAAVTCTIPFVKEERNVCI